jgi:HlyD family secretion protein
MKKRWIIVIAGIVAIGIVAAVLIGARPQKSATKAKQGYEFTTAKRGSIEKTISTSGTLEPVSKVSVLAQMSGRVESVTANYNDHVKKGQVLVSLNTDMLKLQELESQAAVQKAQATYDLDLLDWQNKSKLAEKGLLSDYDLASSKTTLAVAAAELASAKASFQVIETELTQYATIKSPIDGIVLNKNVEVGQSVVEGSSSNSTTLFTLAEDLSNMEIEAEVDELDIGGVKANQEVRFTVDSRPGVTYEGHVKEIHLIPETTNSIVNYYVIIAAPNKGSTLLPGMTATIQFIESKKSDILLVPNAALRYVPSSLSAAQIAKKTFLAGLSGLTPEERTAAEARYDAELSAAAGGKTTKATARTGTTGLAGMVMGGGGPGMGGGPGGPGGSRRSGASANGSAATGTQASEPSQAEVAKKALWYVDNSGEIQCVLVEPGVTDGLNTEVSEAEGLENLRIILKEKAN